MRHKSGFTLIEMAMVLTIIALLVGGIMMGSSLIRSNELTSAISDVGRYTAAINSFRDKYKYYPGDMYQANMLWGAVSGGCPNGTGNVGEVCSGDGNGHVCDTANDNNAAEVHSEWIMLANAGFINGTYNYIAANSAYIIGSSSPQSSVTGGTFSFYYAACPMGDGLYTNVSPYNIHWMSFGALHSTSGIAKPIVNGSEAYAIDKKSDDGKPGTGSIRGSRNATAGGFTASCQTTASATTALYSQTSNVATCYLMFALPE